MSSTQLPIKKVFTTYWDKEPVKFVLSPKMLSTSQFFHMFNEGTKKEFAEIVFPCDVKHTDIMVFQGRKTRITIETIE